MTFNPEYAYEITSRSDLSAVTRELGRRPSVRYFTVNSKGTLILVTDSVLASVR